MNDTLESHFSGTDYEPVLKDHAEPSYFIMHATAEAEVIYTSCERGHSHSITTCLVDIHRLNQRCPRVSMSTISRFIRDSPHIHDNLRPSRVRVCL